MIEPNRARRRSYGPTSPDVGERGTRTRSLLLEAARRCFVERGFHATSIENVTAIAETSRATLYQYFESKEAMFVELMYESGNTLVELARGLGQLGDSPEGFANLRNYVRAWTENFDRFAPTFVEWTNVAAPSSPLRAEVLAYTNAYGTKMGALLEESGHVGVDTRLSALLVQAVLSRYNHIRHVYRPDISDPKHLAALTCGLQRFLFPGTPHAVLRAAAPRRAVASPPHMPPDAFSRVVPRDRRAIAAAAIEDGRGPRAAATVGRLLDAGARVFAREGYRAANIDQIVAEAGLARGTFYLYFASKFDLMLALSSRTSLEMRPLFEIFPSVAENADERVAWLRALLVLQRRYAGVLRTWSEGYPTEHAILSSSSDLIVEVGRSVSTTFGDDRRYPLTRLPAALMFAAVLEHFPTEVTGTIHDAGDDALTATQSLFIERVLLPTDHERRR